MKSASGGLPTVRIGGATRQRRINSEDGVASAFPQGKQKLIWVDLCKCACQVGPMKSFASGHRFEWAEIKQDLKALQTVTLEENGSRLAVRTQCKGVCGKVFQSEQNFKT